MVMSERDRLLMFLFEGNDRELVNMKFFRGLRDLVSEDEFCAQIHSALMQKRMGKAVVADDFVDGVTKIDAEEFVASL